MIKKLSLASLALLGLLLVQACVPYLPKEKSCNFVTNTAGQRVSWKDGSLIHVYIHDSVPIQYEAAIEDAVAEWNSTLVHTQIQLESGVSTNAVPKKDGYSMIYLLNDWEEEKSLEQARTTVYWSGSHIYEADIRINEKNFNYFLTSSNEEPDYTKVHLKSLIVHELGHLLGLSHNNGEASVMAEILLNGKFRDKVEDEEKESLRCEYVVEPNS